MSDLVEVKLIVNGEEVTVAVTPMTRLSTVLRENLGLTGTHLACEEGVCGSCTVLVDGRTLRSCLTLAVQMDGSDIVTAEGFAAVPRLRRIQEAFVSHCAAQCGFCTSGMMAVVAEYLDDVPLSGRDTDAAIRGCLNSVICRCTGYQFIVDAVRELVAQSVVGEGADD